MDNEKTPKFLKEILERGKGAGTSANEVNAVDKEKILAPLKDASATSPNDKPVSEKHRESLDKDSGSGRGRGGSATPSAQSDGEHKTPTKKFLEKGEHKPFRGGRGGGLGGSDDLLKNKKDFINPDDILSDKGTGKQQKQEPQQQAEHNKPAVKENPVLVAKELLNKIKEGQKQPEIQAKETNASKEINQLSVKERIAKAVAAKENQPVKEKSSDEKSVRVAENKVKPPSPKTPKI